MQAPTPYLPFMSTICTLSPRQAWMFSVHRHQRLVQPQIRTVKTVLQIISPNARSIAKQHRSIIDRDRIVDCASLEAQLRLASNASGEQFVELRLCLRSADRFLSRSRPRQNQRKCKQQ